ncbi:MAG TPA: NACHT domain-containing protein [Streptosporangiaceae bacterium]|nr:NACHT domain-containing protein [Streptosporangiaceae bacterium]
MRNGRGRWPWAVAGTGLAGLTVLLVVTVVPLGGRDGLQKSAGIGQITGLVIAVGTAAVALVVWAWRTAWAARDTAIPVTDVLERAKDLLAGAVAQQWKDEARLRSLDNPDPIPVRWRTPEQAAVMDHPANIQHGASRRVSWTASSADIGALADQFRRTRRRRLVILGGPGSGKTTLAMQLLLHLLAARNRHHDEPVPVLLPVAGWDTERFPRLHDWLADRLPRDYPALRSPGLGVGIAQALTGRGHILPVLDGLDEMPPPAQAKVITALNRSLGGDDQLILTSRTTEFTAAVTAAGDVLTSAAVLEPLPLDPASAADYLTRCLPTSPGPAWQHVLIELRNASPPGNAASPPGAVLADVAATPLGLWLLRTVYTAPAADPTALTDPVSFPAPAALWAHLFDQLIPAVIAAREPSNDPAEPFRPRHRHDPDDTRRWLAYLAHHLTSQHGPADGGQATHDFAWWRLAATTHAVTRTTATTIALLPGLTAALIAALIAGLTSGPIAGLLAGVTTGLMAVLMLGLMAGRLFGHRIRSEVRSWGLESPGYADLRIRDRRTELLRRLALGLVTALLTGLPLGLVAGLTTGLTTGLAVGLPGAIALGLAGTFTDWAETPAQVSHATTPMGNWRADRTLNLLRISTIGPASGLMFGLMAGHLFGFQFGFAGGFAAGFVGALVSGKHRAWAAYLIATRRLARAGLLPRRLMPFLDDCHRLGLLRAVGPLYQFRHAELQAHLAAAYPSARSQR